MQYDLVALSHEGARGGETKTVGRTGNEDAAQELLPSAEVSAPR